METLTIQSKTANTDGFVGDAKIEDYGNAWYDFHINSIQELVHSLQELFGGDIQQH